MEALYALFGCGLMMLVPVAGIAWLAVTGRNRCRRVDEAQVASLRAEVAALRAERANTSR